jgi:hypothetical protein
MTRSDVPWIPAALGAVAAEASQVAATFGWVTIYSYVIDPGRSPEHYQAYAAASAPWVSVVAGLPIFYAASRWIARDLASALALFGVFVVMDVALLAAAGGFGDASGTLGPVAVSWATKLLACHLGGAAAEIIGRSSLPGAVR